MEKLLSTNQKERLVLMGELIQILRNRRPENKLNLKKEIFNLRGDEANEEKPGTDRGLVLVIDALLREAGVPHALVQKIFFLLSDDEQQTDWAIIGDFSSFLARLVAIKTLQGKCLKSERTKKRYLNNAEKSWWNDWYGRNIFDIRW